MARAPLLLSESMLFPYREGLSFEQDLWMDEGQHAAFAGALDRPPSSTWEIINPRVYEKKEIPSVPLLPNRTCSTGNRWQISSASSYSSVWGIPYIVPISSRCCTAFTTAGWQCPAIKAPKQRLKSTYSLPSRS